jgi:hypothetical protein
MEKIMPAGVLSPTVNQAPKCLLKDHTVFPGNTPPKKTPPSFQEYSLKKSQPHK